MINRDIPAIASEIAQFFRPRKKRDGLQYVEEEGYVTGSALSRGKWHTRPYQERWFTWLTDPEVQVFACVKSSRVGWTRATITGFVQYHVDEKPSQIMGLFPTATEIEKYATEFKDPHFDTKHGVPCCIGLSGPKGSKSDLKNRSDYTVFRNGAVLDLVSAATPRSFRMTERPIIFWEEPSGCGRVKEGSLLGLLMKRALTAPDPKICIGGTPVELFDYMHEAFLKGDQQHRYYPFPCCGRQQELTMEKLIKEGEDIGKMRCENCQTPIPHTELPRMDRLAAWACPLVVEHGRERQVLRDGLPIWESQYVWAAMSYEPGASWPLIVEEYNDALRELRAGNSDPMLTFKNTTEGVSWQDVVVVKIGTDGLTKRRANAEFGNDYPAETVPNGVVMITIGVDVQGGDGSLGQGLHVYVWGMSRGEERWHLAEHRIDCDPAQTGVIDEILCGFTSATWRREDGAELQMLAGAIDDGGHASEEVRRFCAANPGRWIACKGEGSELFKRSANPVGFKSRRKTGGVQGRDLYLYSVGYEPSIRLWRDRLGVEQPGPGYIHLGQAASDQTLMELFPWKRVRVAGKLSQSGEPVYRWDKPAGARDEAGDCARLAYAAFQYAATLVNPKTMWDRWEAQALRTIAPAPQPKPQSALKSTSKRPGGFVTNW